MARPIRVPVTRFVPHPDGTRMRALADRDYIAETLGYAAYTIRRYCTRHSVDPATGRALYDLDEVRQVLADAGVKPRAWLQGKVRRPRHAVAAQPA